MVYLIGLLRQKVMMELSWSIIANDGRYYQVDEMIISLLQCVITKAYHARYHDDASYYSQEQMAMERLSANSIAFLD